MGMINDLYHGNINPIENFGYPKNQTYTDLVEDIQKIEDSLLSSLEEKEEKVFMTIKQNRTELNNMELERMFEFAFKLGVQLGAELFQE